MPHAYETRPGMSFFDDVDDDDASGPDQRPSTDTPATAGPTTRRRGRRAACALALSGLVVGLLAVILPASASAAPSANDWYRLRVCESSDNYSINTGNGHYGAYQFDLGTWRSVGGSGLPSAASKAEQDKRALALYRSRGWQPWQCARIIGLIGGSGSSTPTTTAHGWPGVSFRLGDDSAALVTWQRQMRARGATLLTGTGLYGPNTELVVTSLQRQNGLAPEGLLGPQTWELAWTGKFVPSTSTRGGAVHVPTWAGTTLATGAWNAQVARWQKQMRVRGATTVTGTGEFGPKTTALVKALQRQNGAPATGRIDARTWRLAWTGSYHR